MSGHRWGVGMDGPTCERCNGPRSEVEDRACPAERLLDVLPPEAIADAVRGVLTDAVDAAIENWDEGFWDEFTSLTPRRDVLAQFGGYIEASLENLDPTDTDDSLNQPLMEQA